MNNLVVNDNVIEALTLRMLDLGFNGEFSYNNSGTKTDKQKNMKRDVKGVLSKWLSEDCRKQSMKLIFDGLLSMNQYQELKQENALLKAKLEAFDDKEHSYRELTKTLYKDELMKQLREELDQDREDAIESSRRVNRRLMETIKQLENQITNHKSKASTEEYEMLRNQNLQMNEIIVDLRKKTALNKKALEIQKILALQETS